MQIINHSDFKQENVIHLALVLVGHSFTEVIRISGGMFKINRPNGQQTHKITS